MQGLLLRRERGPGSRVLGSSRAGPRIPAYAAAPAVLQDCEGLVRAMRRFGRTDLGADDLEDSELDKFINGAALLVQHV